MFGKDKRLTSKAEILDSFTEKINAEDHQTRCCSAGFIEAVLSNSRKNQGTFCCLWFLPRRALLLAASGLFPVPEMCSQLLTDGECLYVNTLSVLTG